MRVSALLGARAPFEMENCSARACGGLTDRRFLRTPTARPHHAVDFGACGRLWKLWTRLWTRVSASHPGSTSSEARAILASHFADSALYEQTVIFSQRETARALHAEPEGALNRSSIRYSVPDG